MKANEGSALALPLLFLKKISKRHEEHLDK
jgi:hypothetical protein